MLPVGFGPAARGRNPVKLKKFPSMELFGGNTKKCVMMSGSLAIVICTMAKVDIIREKSLKVEEDRVKRS